MNSTETQESPKKPVGFDNMEKGADFTEIPMEKCANDTEIPIEKCADEKRDSLDLTPTPKYNLTDEQIENMSDAELEETILLLKWWNNWKDTNNEAFVDLLFNESRYLVLKGGGGSGKSIFAGRKILERCVSENDHRFLVCRKVARTLRESCFAQLVSQLYKYYPNEKVEINKGDMQITFPRTHSKILFTGLDDVEKLKSIYEITGMWIEEASELLEDDFNQLDIRLRGETKYYKQIILSFNPINIVHWLKIRFFDNTPEDCTLSETTYLDNRFLDEAQGKVLRGFKDSDEYYYNVYCLGNWGVSGKTVFDARAIQGRLEQNPQPLAVGHMDYFYDGNAVCKERFVKGEGSLRIYKYPEEGVPYIIGCDTSGDGSDASVIQVINGVTMEQVATYYDSDVDEDVFAHTVFAVGMYYNKALVAIECNFSSYPIREMERLNYRRLYVREVVDNYTHGIRKAFGFRTDVKTRPVIISELVKMVREDVSFLNDRKTMEEMLTFVRNVDTYKPEAEEGAHDDTVMALAIAVFARNSGQLNLNKNPVVKRKVRWTKDMWEDYMNAPRSERIEMRERWGTPYA